MKTKKMMVLTIMTMVLTCGSVWAADIILNEYNAVSSGNYLGDSGSDSYFGTVEGNGGDWFELVVITDHLDMRGWDLAMTFDGGSDTLTLTSNSLWSDLRSGTIITVSEDETEDVSYDPDNDDWWINVRANNGGSGTYIEADNFPVNNSDWQLTIKDDLGATIFGPAGEGVSPSSGIGSDEVFYLSANPRSPITEDSPYYNEGTSSTFGSPNPGQSFSPLRDVISDLEMSFTDPANNVSGVIDGSTDPAANNGINFTIGHATVSSSSLTVEAESSNTSVVPNNSQNLILSGTGDNRNLKIVPDGVGYATITITVSYLNEERSIDFEYAASAASNTQTSRYHTGMSDASTAVAQGSDHMFVANDEDIGAEAGPIYLYDRYESGLPITKFNFTDDLDLVGNREVDIEASTRIGNRIFWLSSHGNNKDGDCRPNRRRLFATDVSGSGVNSTLSFVGYYDDLREDLIAWDEVDDHGKGEDYYGLKDSAYCTPTGGVPPKSESANGFNIEGLVMSPDGDDAYICFRAPISPVSARTKALIVPIVDFETWFNDGSPSGSPTFGNPIELDLGGRGIRSIDKNDADEYLIVAGSYGTTGAAPHDFRLYSWTGSPYDDPELDPSDLSDLISEGGSIESIVKMPAPMLDGDVQFLLDNGTSDWYNDLKESKFLPYPTFQKYRSDWIDKLGWPCVSDGLQQDGDADGDGTVEFNTSGPSGTDDYDKWWVSYNTSTYSVCCDFDRDGDVDWDDRTIGIAHNCDTGSPCTNCQGI